MILPKTINHPQAFLRNAAAGFDGVWDWSCLLGAFPRGISPTDYDGNVEINGHFLRFETKEPGVAPTKGQFWALTREHPNYTTVVFLWGKGEPIWRQVWHQGSMRPRRRTCADELFIFCVQWVKWAEGRPRPSHVVDVDYGLLDVPTANEHETIEADEWIVDYEMAEQKLHRAGQSIYETD